MLLVTDGLQLAPLCSTDHSSATVHEAFATVPGAAGSG